MTDIIQLKTAKYKGVELLFESVTTTGGNRLIKFNYPGSDKQSIERQGKRPLIPAMNIIIRHDGYEQKRDEIIRVLSDGVKGVLTHPTLGDINNVINGEFVLTEIISELGRARITVTFEIDDGEGIPPFDLFDPGSPLLRSRGVVLHHTSIGEESCESFGVMLDDGFHVPSVDGRIVIHYSLCHRIAARRRERLAIDHSGRANLVGSIAGL